MIRYFKTLISLALCLVLYPVGLMERFTRSLGLTRPLPDTTPTWGRGLIRIECNPRPDLVCQQPPEEFTCCHCLQQQAASEDNPIGLVTLIQSSSVLAHKHSSKAKPQLVLPTSPEEEEALPAALARSLGKTQINLDD